MYPALTYCMHTCIYTWYSVTYYPFFNSMCTAHFMIRDTHDMTHNTAVVVVYSYSYYIRHLIRGVNNNNKKRHVEMQPAGRGMLGCCPFHDDRTPSFSVDDSRGSYHCFGCGASGDVITFLMQVTRHESNTRTPNEGFLPRYDRQGTYIPTP